MNINNSHITEESIRFGIIGYGKMGKIRAQAIRNSGYGVVAAVTDHEAGSPPEGAYWASDAQHVIADPCIDAVFICTPNFLNKPLTIKSLEAGKHVFCEKPPAFTATELQEIRSIEQKSGCILMYGFNHRHHASIQKMKNLIESGDLGKVLWMRGRYGKEVEESFFGGWRAKKELAGGGIMLDQGIHMLDLFLYLGGNFDEVQAMVSNLFWKMDGIEDNVFANFRSSITGICASLHSTMTQWRYIFSLEVFLENGALILNGLKTSSGAYGDEELTIKRNAPLHGGAYNHEEKINFDSDDSWDSEVLMFSECIRHKTNPKIGTSSDALDVMNLIDLIYAK